MAPSIHCSWPLPHFSSYSALKFCDSIYISEKPCRHINTWHSALNCQQVCYNTCLQVRTAFCHLYNITTMLSWRVHIVSSCRSLKISLPVKSNINKIGHRCYLAIDTRGSCCTTSWIGTNRAATRVLIWLLSPYLVSLASRATIQSSGCGLQTTPPASLDVKSRKLRVPSLDRSRRAVSVCTHNPHPDLNIFNCAMEVRILLLLSFIGKQVNNWCIWCICVPA